MDPKDKPDAPDKPDAMSPEDLQALAAALAPLVVEAMKAAASPEPDPADEPEVEDAAGPTVADMRRVLDAAKDGEVELTDDMTYDAAVQAVGGGLTGRSDASVEECAVAIRVAAKIRADAAAQPAPVNPSPWSGKSLQSRADANPPDANGVIHF